MSTNVNKKKVSYLKRRERMFWVYISPWLFGIVFFVSVPLIYSLYLSFTRYNLLSPPRFIGLRNFVRIFTDNDNNFYRSLGYTFTFALIKIPLNTLLALAIASLLNKIKVLKGLFRTLLYTPAVIPSVAGAMIWLFMFDYENGLINYALNLINLPSVSWLDMDHAPYAIIMLSVWSGMGPTMIIFLAALQGVPKVYVEAMEIDGANKAQIFLHVTVPMISPTILFVLITGIINSLQAFSEMFLMTGGGPNYATTTLTLLIYQYAFTENSMGAAAALSWILLIITLIITGITFKLTDRHVYYEGGN